MFVVISMVTIAVILAVFLWCSIYHMINVHDPRPGGYFSQPFDDEV